MKTEIVEEFSRPFPSVFIFKGPCGVLTYGRSRGSATEVAAVAAEGEGSGAGARGADESEAQAGWRRRLAWGGGGGGGGHRHGESTGEEGGRAGVSSVC